MLTQADIQGMSEAEVKAAWRQQLKPYQADPMRFYSEVLDVKPDHIWSKMRDVAESVRDHQFTAVPAGHSVSKTYSAARLSLWFKTCFQPSTVITTAPSDNQVRNQLWREVHTAYQGAKWPLGGRLTTLQWDCVPLGDVLDRLPQEERGQWEKNFAIGFSTTPDSVSEHATRMQGWHNKYLLVILDEACGILPPIWRAVLDGLIVNERCKVLAIGNPTDPAGIFCRVCQEDSGWNVIRVSIRDTPNYIEGKEIIPHVAGRDYEQRIISEYGEGSSEHRYRCLGEFPDFGEGSVFDAETFEVQAKRLREPIQYGLFDHKTGTFILNQNNSRYGWAYLDGPGAEDHVIGVDTREHRLSDDKDPMSERDNDGVVVLGRKSGQKRVKAILRGRMGSKDLALQVLGAAKHYNNAWVVPEIPQGMMVVQTLVDARYVNIYNRRQHEDTYEPQDTEQLGYRTTSASRPLLVNEALAVIKSGIIWCQFQYILDEMLTFRWDKSGKPIHAPGKHDDLLFGLFLAIQGDLYCPRTVPMAVMPATTGAMADERFSRGQTDRDLARMGTIDHQDDYEDYDEEGWYRTG